MPKVSRESASQGGEYGPVTDRSDEIEGYTVNFTTFNVDLDQSSVLKGLPNDECQCPHWGYVVKGSLTMRSGDSEEVLKAGDAYYLAPGHVGIGNEPGTEVVQFSPTDALKKTDEVIMKNMQASQGG
jgi:quercetin dioxygenase-like cupin family protein